MHRTAAGRFRQQLGLRIVSLAVLCSAALTPALAQAGARTVSDPLGRFSIGVPDGWTAAAVDEGAVARSLPAAARPRIDASTSGLMAIGPHGVGETPPLLVITATPVADGGDDPTRLVGALRASPGIVGLRIMREGTATVAGLPAYYMYVVAQSPDPAVTLYGLMVFVAAGQTGFYVYGATVNDPGRIQSDFATILAVLNTLQPTASPIAQAPPAAAPPLSAADEFGAVFAVFAVPRTPSGQYELAGGTAFFISPDGTALTNSHVVHEAYVNPAYQLIALVSGEYYGATVVCASVLSSDPWTNPRTPVPPSRDIAEIRLTDPPDFPYQSLHPRGTQPYGYAHQGPLPTFPALPLGNEPAVGDPVHFLGFGHTLTSSPSPLSVGGTVRAVDTASDGTPIFAMQLDGDAVHGDSGSPVLDADNRVVGLLAWAGNPGSHLGFAMTRAALSPACR